MVTVTLIGLLQRDLVKHVVGAIDVVLRNGKMFK